MAMNSKIEWTGATWNPVAGCTWASRGCDHCYAATMTRRLGAMGQADYAGLTSRKHFNGKVRTLPHKLDVPLRRHKPTTWFVNSMSDLFHQDVPFDFIDRVFAVMALCPQHTFQVLTKRPERMAEWANSELVQHRIAKARDGITVARKIAELKEIRSKMKTGGVGVSATQIRNIASRQQWATEAGIAWPLPNCWLGTSIEDQTAADERIPHLLRVPAAVRFLSVEPLLGLVELSQWIVGKKCNWVIVGGESGPGARPMHPAWARSLRDQCVAAGVPFFFKQGSSANWKDFKNFDGFPDDLKVRQFPATYQG